MKRGLLFSTDAMIALFILFSIIMGIFVLLSHAEGETFQNKGLKNTGYDAVELMKAHGLLSEGIEEKEQRVLASFMWEYLPHTKCARLELQDKFGLEIHTELKPGCRYRPSPDNVRIIVPFIHENQIHNAEMILWYK